MIAALPVELRELPGARREMCLRLGQIAVTVTEVPGWGISDGEWRDILLARRSYAAMWGGVGTDIVTNDPLDGVEPTSCYRTRHYLSWVNDRGEPERLVTMRLVELAPSALTERQRSEPGELLPVDIRFWRVRTEDGGHVPFWDVLRDRARMLAPRDGLAEFRIATMGRTGTFPYDGRRSPSRSERTAIAYAAIHLLATHDDPSLFYVCSVCAEFQDRVASVCGADGVRVRFVHSPSEVALGLPPGSVSLDNRLRLVREHKLSFPGYFVDNDDAARVIASLLDDGRVGLEDLVPTIELVLARERRLGASPRLLEELAALVRTPDHRRLAELLTRPRLFKYLTPRLVSEQPLAGMSAEAFRAALLDGTADGPFSATMATADWSAHASAVLGAAYAKYSSG